MKRIKEILCLFILFLIPINVFAESKSVIKAPDKASPDQEISIDIVVSDDVAIDSFKANLTYETSVLEILSIENKNDWIDNTELKKESPLALDFAHNNGIRGETTVATIKFKVKKDVSKSNTVLTLEASTKTKEEGTINTLDKISKTIDIKSTDNTISEIKVNGEPLLNFSPNQYEYEKVVSSSTTTVSFDVTLNDKTATFKDKYAPKKNAPLDYGPNPFEIIVVSASGEERKYVVTIERPDNRGTNNFLKQLIINSNQKLLPFEKTSTKYSVTTHKLETIDISAEAEDPNATVEIKKPDKLVIGSNEVTVTVTSEKKESRVYTITINNLDTDIDTTLKNIELLGVSESLNFDPNVYDYELTYKSSYKDTLVIKETVNNEDEAISSKTPSDCSNLKAGDKVIITVSAKDGTKNVERYYTITFKKDNRINFFLILSLTIFIVLLVVFIKLVIENKKEKKKIEEKETEIEKTKRLEKINLE